MSYQDPRSLLERLEDPSWMNEDTIPTTVVRARALRRRRTRNGLAAGLTVLVLVAGVGIVAEVANHRSPSSTLGVISTSPTVAHSPTPSQSSTSTPQTPAQQLAQRFATNNLAWPYVLTSNMSATMTAENFVAQFLNYPDIATVKSSTVSGADATVSLGLAAIPKQVAAVITLKRISGTWYVTGTKTQGFAISAAGSSVTPPASFTVDGTITGVDESINAELVMQVAGNMFNGQIQGQTAQGVPAGGQGTPWSATFPFLARLDPFGTVGPQVFVGRTGGHVAEIERIAIFVQQIPTSG